MNLNEIYEQAEREDKLVAVVKYPYQKPEAVYSERALLRFGRYGDCCG